MLFMFKKEYLMLYIETYRERKGMHTPTWVIVAGYYLMLLMAMIMYLPMRICTYFRTRKLLKEWELE